MEENYKYEDELRNRAMDYIELLNEEGITASVVMVRDYMIKLEITVDDRKYGRAVIYYKPSTGSFSLRTHELKDNGIKGELERIWHNRDPALWDLCHIYVDGSYVNSTVSYGFVAVRKGEIIAEDCGTVTDPVYLESHQVGGEIKAVEKGLQWAKRKNLKKIVLYYDFANLEKWVTGEYRANTPLTRRYREFMETIDVEIVWKKVTAHTGDKWNEYADKLARKGLEGN